MPRGSRGRVARFAPRAEESCKQLYHRLFQNPIAARAQARAYLEECLREVRAQPDVLPRDPGDLFAWSRTGSTEIGRRYRDYLAARKAGRGRQFFTSKSHALYFLRGVAPTKLVDGAWLYGMLAHWRDERFIPLIRTYLEELGEGRPEHNHVVLYRQLLDKHGCDDWRSLSDEHFVQGTIQLALAELADEFLPEVIGYNLGYEQLPLHLLITAYELNELGIDPYYFTLHVTIDNAATGHARKAVEAVLDLLPSGEAGEAFYRRLCLGYKLNGLGVDTPSMIKSFDLERELVRVLSAKAGAGAGLHSDYCRIGGVSINEWLCKPAALPRLLRCLEKEGWIRRGAAAEESRFWRLIEGERATMFGVFSRYEKQLLREWIEGASRREPSFRARARLAERRGEDAGGEPVAAPDISPRLPAATRASVDGKATELMALMSPARHHAPQGLAATRAFTELLEWR